MLRRFNGCSLRILRVAQIGSTTRYCPVPVCFHFQKSNYATTVVNQEITNSSSLDSDINVLENRAKCRRQLSNRDLHSLLLKLSKERANSTQTLEILRYCTHAITEQNQCDIVNDIWNELKKCNNEFQIEHYNHMLRFAADKIDVKRAEEIFDEMIKNGIVPDATSYNALLTIYCKSKDAKKATEIFAVMEKNNVIIKDDPLNLLMECQMSCGNVDAANEVMVCLQARKIRRSAHTLCTLLNHYSKANDSSNIKRHFELFSEENVNLKNSDIIEVMCELSANEHPKEIDSLSAHLKPFKLDDNFYDAITFCVEKKQSSIISKVLESVDGDATVMYMFLIQEMNRLSSTEADFSDVIASMTRMSMMKSMLKLFFGENIHQAKEFPEFLRINEGKIKVTLTRALAHCQGSEEMERHKFIMHLRSGNIIDVETLLAKKNFILIHPDYMLLIDLYIKLGNLKNALDILKQACSNCADFKMDRVKIAKIVKLMVENEYDFNEIEDLLRAHPQIGSSSPSHTQDSSLYSNLFECIFKRLADIGNLQVIEQLFDAFIKNGYITPTSESTKPIIAAYLQNKSWSGAVAKYEHFANTYKFVTSSLGLYIHLIQHNQDELLQRANTTLKRINGENSVSNCLASALTECGRYQQAHDILKKYDAKHLSTYVNGVCNAYTKSNQLNALNTLLKATKRLNCNRFHIYRRIFDMCEKQNMASEALVLWREYSGDDEMIPNLDFLQRIENLLIANSIEIPAELKKTCDEQKQTKKI